MSVFGDAFDPAAALAYARRLRGDRARVNPPSWRVDWADAPWPFKVYGDAPRDGGAGDAVRGRLLGLLTELTGVTRVRARLNAAKPTLRRPVASGGAMYPAELYAVVTGSGGGRPGVLHFDAARHELVELGGPDPVRPLLAALGGDERTPPAPAAVVVTHRFWKNYYKYGEFAYRLGAVDLGVVLGRMVRRLGEDPYEIRVDFDDALLSTLLGLDERDEGPYAVVLVGRPGSAPRVRRSGELPRPVVHERSARVRRSADLSAMHAAASRPPGPPAGVVETDEPRLPGERRLALPGEHGALPVLPGRTSNGRLFTGAPASARDLAAVLRDAAGVLASLTGHCPDPGLPGLALYCAVTRVEGVEPGWYGYDPACHALVPAARVAASPAAVLGQATHSPGLNAELAAFTVHAAGKLDFRGSARGARQYRVQQMLAGATVDAVTVAATALGLGSHPLLGFDAAQIDRSYALPAGYGVLTQVCVGPARAGAALEGAVW